MKSDYKTSTDYLCPYLDTILDNLKRATENIEDCYREIEKIRSEADDLRTFAHEQLAETERLEKEAS